MNKKSSAIPSLKLHALAAALLSATAGVQAQTVTTESVRVIPAPAQTQTVETVETTRTVPASPGVRTVETTRTVETRTTAAPAPAVIVQNVPDPIKVPPGHRPVLEATVSGQILYQCVENLNIAPEEGKSLERYRWVVRGPKTAIKDRQGVVVGDYYYEPRAMWESRDGTKLVGTPVATVTNGNNLPLQLIKVDPTSGTGPWNGVTYIQRVNTRGGGEPDYVCRAETERRKKTSDYSADYIFWKAQ